MTAKRKIEVFSDGCPACDDVVSLVQGLACPSCEVDVLDMRVTAIFIREVRGSSSTRSAVLGGPSLLYRQKQSGGARLA